MNNVILCKNYIIKTLILRSKLQQLNDTCIDLFSISTSDLHISGNNLWAPHLLHFCIGYHISVLREHLKTSRI